MITEHLIQWSETRQSKNNRNSTIQYGQKQELEGFQVKFIANTKENQTTIINISASNKKTHNKRRTYKQQSTLAATNNNDKPIQVT